MNSYRLHYQVSKSVAFDLDGMLYILGANQREKLALFRAIQRWSTGASYTLMEENFYGQTGIQVYKNSQTLQPKKIKVINIASVEDFLKQFEPSKDSLFSKVYHEVLFQKLNFDQLEQVNDLLGQVETNMNQLLAELIPHYQVLLSDVTVDTLLNKWSNFYFSKNSSDFVLSTWPVQDLIQPFFDLCRKFVTQTGLPLLINWYYPSTIFQEEDLYALHSGLASLADETKMVETLMYDDRVPSGMLSQLSTEHLFIACQTLQQLPSLETVYDSISRHHPSCLQIPEGELLEAILAISPYLGANSLPKASFSHQYLILLYVVRFLLEDYPLYTPETSDLEEPSSCDYHFLRDKEP